MARIAWALATAPSSASARPCFRTTTTGLPTAATASASCCCGAGTTISVRDCASPDMFAPSPIASTTTSACRAAATACSMPPASGSSTPEPWRDDQPILVGERRANAGREIDRLGIVAIDDPRTDQIVRPGCKRTDQRDLLARARQRQQVAVVLEQDDRLAPGLARQRARLRKHRSRRSRASTSMRRNGSSNRPSIAFSASTRRTDSSSFACGHLAAANEVGQMLAVEAALHAHVDAGEEGEPRGIAPVLREAVRDHLLVAGVVGDDEALETPFAAQAGRSSASGCRSRARR